MQDSTSRNSRRRFFAGTAAVAAGAMVAVRQSGQVGEPTVTAEAAAEDKRFGSGISEHMRKYYRTTLI